MEIENKITIFVVVTSICILIVGTILDATLVHTETEIGELVLINIVEIIIWTVGILTCFKLMESMRG